MTSIEGFLLFIGMPSVFMLGILGGVLIGYRRADAMLDCYADENQRFYDEIDRLKDELAKQPDCPFEVKCAARPSGLKRLLASKSPWDHPVLNDASRPNEGLANG